jgi:hypothetical protein
MMFAQYSRERSYALSSHELLLKAMTIGLVAQVSLKQGVNNDFV